MGEKVIFLTDRSAAETDDTCGMKLWWERHALEGGIVPATTAEALAVGIAIHEDMEMLAEMEDIRPEILQAVIDNLLTNLSDSDKLDQKRMEILYRRLGWFAAWGLFQEPAIREEWTNVGIEKELILDRDPLWVQVKPDRLLKNIRQPSFHKYMEYKSSISASKKWLESWRYQIQLHTSLKAVMEESGEDIRYAQVVGFMKGNYSPTDNRLTHPYVWAYYNEHTKEWTHDYQKARSNSWTPMPVWEYPGGVVEWVQRCNVDVAAGIFPSSPPIFLDNRMLDNWIERRAARERQISQVKETCKSDERLRNIFFEARTSKCRPAFGDPCPYLSLCWNAGRQRDPLATGDFVKRVPHHDLEAIGVI